MMTNKYLRPETILLVLSSNNDILTISNPEIVEGDDMTPEIGEW